MLRFGTSSVQSSPEKYTSSIKACSLICTGVVFVFFAEKELRLCAQEWKILNQNVVMKYCYLLLLLQSTRFLNVVVWHRKTDL